MTSLFYGTHFMRTFSFVIPPDTVIWMQSYQIFLFFIRVVVFCAAHSWYFQQNSQQLPSVYGTDYRTAFALPFSSACRAEKAVIFPQQYFHTVSPSSTEQNCTVWKQIKLILLLYDRCQSAYEFPNICMDTDDRAAIWHELLWEQAESKTSAPNQGTGSFRYILFICFWIKWNST